MQTPNATSIMGVFGGLLQHGTSRFRRPTWNSLVSESSFLTFTRQNDGFAIKLVARVRRARERVYMPGGRGARAAEASFEWHMLHRS